VLSESERATVAKVKDGETLELTDGRLVRLIGAKSPLPPLGWRGDDPWPQVEESRQSLVALAEGAEVELKFGGIRTDRYGHLLAQVFVVREKDRIWVQERLIEGGLARAYSFADNQACMVTLQKRS
jgi:micrococcal nuclease